MPESHEVGVKGLAGQFIWLICLPFLCAQVTRDRLMVEYDRVWPVYGFKQHKGYGTAAHMAALALHGPCPIHRRSFEPIKSMLANQQMPSDCPS